MINTTWYGPVLDQSGYGTVDRNIVTSLYKLDKHVKLYFYNHRKDKSHIPNEHLQIIQTLSNNFSTNNIIINHNIPTSFIYKVGKKNIGMTTFETASVPDHWVPSLRGMDEIWVPSAFNVDTFATKIDRNKIKLVPFHGVDPKIFNNEALPFDIAFRTKYEHIFGYSFDFNDRKGMDVLVKAYMQAFTSKDNVLLLLKTFTPIAINNKSEWIKRELRKIINTITKQDKPDIYIITDELKESQMPGIFKLIDTFISPSRGEGFGLNILEAYAVGCNIVTSDVGGQRDFFDETNSFLIKTKKVPVPDNIMLHQISNNYKGEEWFEPNIDHLITIMKEIHKGARKPHTKPAITWEDCAKNIANILTEYEK